MHTKPIGKYVWILHLKDHLSKLNIVYVLKIQKLYTISAYLFVTFIFPKSYNIITVENLRELY